MAVLDILNSGLSTQEVQKRLKQYGYNEIEHKEHFTAIKIFMSQFMSFLIIILTIAGAIAIYLHEIIDGLAIIGIVLINAIIGFLQEYKAENAVRALKKMVVPTAIVIRNEEEMQINIRELVPGDIIILAEGDKIPADAHIIESYSLRVDESMLTGESIPVEKEVSETKSGKLFKGTLITTGRAKAKVSATGKFTEFGKIIELVSKEEKTRSPLTKQLDQLGKQVGISILGLVVILFALGIIRGVSMTDMLMISVALGVSAIPEGMPIIVTLTLAMGVQALAKKKAIIRKMNAIETLGATTIICSDKTGTLTLNEMTVKKINTNFKEVEIPGLGYTYTEKINLTSHEEKKLLEICENCNNSFINKTIIGDPTEIALKVLTRKARFVKAYKELDENVFTSERKMMSSLHVLGKTKEIMAKGAFEMIISKSSHILKNGKVIKFSASDKKQYALMAEQYAAEALRVLAFAYKPYKGKFDEKNLIFVGIVGMLDPPRKTVKASIELAQKAGILVRVITGDNAITAKAIGEKIGLKIHNIATGDQIDKLSDAKLKKLIYETEIFARTKPEHKYRIVNILKKNHEVVAVTGDGVNDAPAIKTADVGVAMGIKGTEATKEVADIVLKDDNFTTIVNTIEEGRRIYNNILAFIKYMLSANFATIFVVGILTLFNAPLPLLALQILWINIATDALPALALGKSKADADIMTRKPHPKKERIFKKFIGFIFVATVIQTIANIILYIFGTGIDSGLGIDLNILSEPSHTRTIIFTQIVMFELLFSFVCKEEKSLTLKSFFSNKSLIFAVLFSFVLQLVMVYTPFMQQIFKTVPLGLQEWAILVPLASTAFAVPAITRRAKQIFRQR